MQIWFSLWGMMLRNYQLWRSRQRNSRGGGENLEGDPRSRRPFAVTTQENIDRIHQMLTNNRRLTISHLANVISISRERLDNILHNELDMSKVSARWVSRLLTPNQKLTRLVMLEANLATFEADLDRFVEHFLTQDECWAITLNQRPKGNPWSGSTQILLLKRRLRRCHPQE